jgi:hypothetical protein
MKMYSTRELNDAYRIVNYFLNTLSRFNIWRINIKEYSGWRPAIKRHVDIRRKYEEMLKASEIQREGKTEA